VPTTNRSHRITCLAGVALLLATLTSACGGQAGNAVSSALSNRPTVALPTAGGGGGTENGGGGGGGGESTGEVTDETSTPSVIPTETGGETSGGGGGGGNNGGGGGTIVVISPASSPPSSPASQGASTTVESGSDTVAWAWIALLALVVILLVALIARSSGRRGAERSDWRTQALHAYAQGASLVDALSVETSGATTTDRQEWIRRWTDIDRRAGSLATELRDVETGSPDQQTTQIIEDLVSSLTVLRSSLRAHAEAGPGSPAGPLTDRLQEFERSLQTFRARLG